MSDAPAGLINSYAVGVDYAPPGRPGPAPSAAPVSKFDPSEHTVADVEAYIAKHPGEADAVLAAEKSGKARATLVGD